MILLTVDEIISLHAKLIERTGGSDGLRDMGLLESAVYSAQGSFGEEEAYPTIEEKAARLLYALVNNHAFVDGNKRIGVFVMLMTLKLNGVDLDYTQVELVEVGLSVASGAWEYSAVLNWIKQHQT
ncbi:MAG: type II toxin-antitoxin system death-on-curing family toxin [Clostridia bacterium]|nr:type II toxin-antitoxin system death-on-curing family toxin [Clostridia bacterium]